MVDREAKATEYRALAQAARVRAASVQTPKHKESWLRIADEWDYLAHAADMENRNVLSPPFSEPR